MAGSTRVVLPPYQGAVSSGARRASRGVGLLLGAEGATDHISDLTGTQTPSQQGLDDALRLCGQARFGQPGGRALDHQDPLAAEGASASRRARISETRPRTARSPRW